jgi:hypothetical protein
MAAACKAPAYVNVNKLYEVYRCWQSVPCDKLTRQAKFSGQSLM